MSGSVSKAYVSTLTPLSNASGIRVVGYNPTADTFVVLNPSALQGLQGPTGATGPQGPQGPQGVPGSPGTNGKTILSGAGAPTNVMGTPGDWYIDDVNKVMYGPKGASSWPAGFSLIGPQGPQGPAGSGGGSGNIADGTVAGQIAVWNNSTLQWEPQTGVSIVSDRTPTVELAAPTALTFAAHNRRRIVLSAAAALTLAASEVTASGGSGMEFVINNDHSAINTITFGAGITVKQPSTGTGTSGAVKVAVDGRIAVEVYPKGAGLIAKIGGDVA